MSALLLTCTAATLVMVGVSWFVQVVHYPLLSEIGSDRFARYHEAHSRLTTRVVIGPMSVELLTAWLLLLEPPAGERALTLVGAALATAAWALTALGAVPAHRALGDGPDPGQLRRLLKVNLVRTATWIGHAGVCLALIALSA